PHAVLVVGGRRVDRRHHGAGTRVRVLTGVDGQGVEAVSHSGRLLAQRRRTVGDVRVKPWRNAVLFTRRTQLELPTPEQALPGRAEPMPVAERHTVLGTPLQGPWPEGFEVAVFGMGCFWGAERIFWRLKGVYST